jgi:signal transduction histidine kinase
MDLIYLQIMKYPKWFLHPVLVLIFSLLALGSSLFLYIYWYIGVSEMLETAVMRFGINPNQAVAPQNWVIILVLSLLLGIILTGISIIFVFLHKTIQLYRMQNNFINNFTHELKTPVTSLKLYLETFQRYDIPREKRLKYLEYMVTDVNRLTDVINRILNLARIESKGFGGDFVRSDLVEFVKTFYEANEHLFGDCRVKFHHPTGHPFFYRINPSLLEMLLMNLFTNAVKYNDAPQARLDVTFQRQGKNFLVQFKDNGIGLEKRHLKKIFKKFYQAGISEDMSAKGSGIGLYLVDSIARIHRGSVRAESQGLGRGTVFTLALPVRHPDFT